MIDVLELSGEAHAKGVEHGRRHAPHVRAHLADWLESLTQATRSSGETYVRRMLRETDFLSAVRRHTPDLLQEARGIAEGAELDPDLIFALQLLDEEWAYRGRREHQARKHEKCSSFAILSSDGPTWIGQNMDLGGYTDSHQVMLRIANADKTPAALVFTIAGMIGLLGVNAHGLGVCVNSLPQLPSAPEGLPVAFVVRRLLQARDVVEAADWVQGLPHATNQHYVIAGPDAIASFEASAAGVTEYRPPDASRVLHTNHPLADVAGAPETAAERENSTARLASLEARLAVGNPALEGLTAALSSFDDPRNPVCRLRDPAAGLIGFTTGSMISALRRGQPVQSWVSSGPPTRAGYTQLTLEAATPG